jgi:hypothetical protein
MRLRQAAHLTPLPASLTFLLQGFMTLLFSEGWAKLTIHKNATVSNDYAEGNRTVQRKLLILRMAL